VTNDNKIKKQIKRPEIASSDDLRQGTVRGGSIFKALKPIVFSVKTAVCGFSKDRQSERSSAMRAAERAFRIETWKALFQTAWALAIN
jgi:hypothetical protein